MVTTVILLTTMTGAVDSSRETLPFTVAYPDEKRLLTQSLSAFY